MASMTSKAAWDREVEKQARQMQWEQQRDERRAERRAANKQDREVERLLRGEAAVRADVKNLLGDNIVTDGAGVEWIWDEESRWWWWRESADGQWQSKGLSWTPLPKNTEAKRTARRPSDAASDSAASSVSTAPTLTQPKGEEKGTVPKQKLSAWAKPLVIAAAPALPAPASAPSSPAHSAYSSAEVSVQSQGQTLSEMAAIIRGQLSLDDSLTIAEVIVKGNRQLNKSAEGSLARQAKSLLKELS